MCYAMQIIFCFPLLYVIPFLCFHISTKPPKLHAWMPHRFTFIRRQTFGIILFFLQSSSLSLFSIYLSLSLSLFLTVSSVLLSHYITQAANMSPHRFVHIPGFILSSHYGSYYSPIHLHLPPHLLFLSYSYSFVGRKE